MIQIINNRKGVSLTLITGFIALLMVISAGISELIIANMRSIQRIESSNRAYYAAEAGLEDALYELSPHFPGYETPALETANVRSTDFDASGWKNEWQIKSRSKSTQWSGKMYADQKLNIYLFDDTTGLQSANKDSINTADAVIQTLRTSDVAGNFSITFKIPAGVISSGHLTIDNDNDFALNGVNEDSPEDSSTCPENPLDKDCDGLVDEDTALDPVIIWKLTDGKGRTLSPKKGCIDNIITPGGSEICEDNFYVMGTDSFGPRLAYTYEGINQDNESETIGQFILDSSSDSQLHFEFLIVAPMEHVQVNKKYAIPYIEYEVQSNNTEIPDPFYTIKSDGYYRAFKQSITAFLTPKSTVPLFDFTIIQQQ